MGNANTKDFYHTDPPLCVLTSCVNHSSIEELGQYLSHIVLSHKDSGFSIMCHKDLAARALLKSSGFLIPQPPLYLRRTMVVHFTNGIPSTFLRGVHKKDNHFFLILDRIPLGM